MRLQKFVEKVEVDLHPTFRPHKIVLEQAPFSVTRIGWCELPVALLSPQAALHARPPACACVVSMLQGRV